MTADDVIREARAGHLSIRGGLYLNDGVQVPVAEAHIVGELVDAGALDVDLVTGVVSVAGDRAVQR